jgi:hypothetical protein
MADTPQDHAALEALVATWRDAAPTFNTAEGRLLVAKCAEQLERALAAAPSGAPVGEPEPSAAPACDDCKDTGIRVNSEGRDAYCHCTASPRPTPQPSAPAISMPADRSAIIAKAIEADDSCISAGAPAAVLPRCPISLCNRTMVCPRHGDVTRAEASMAMNEQLAAVLPEPCHNCAGSDPVSLTWMCAECLTAMADVLLEPVDVEALARETAEQVSWCVVDDKPARERVILAALRRVQPAAVRAEPQTWCAEDVR